MRGSLETDHLVVGAGAAGMAFVDALVDHGDAEVVIVDRRHAPGGHWLDAYPFVRLHQASVFYGVASTQLGDGSVQRTGPEAGLHERASASEVCAYYARVLDRLVATGRVRFLGGHDHLGNGVVRSRLTGQEYDVAVRRSMVDARYLEPEIPATTPPPFAVDAGAVVRPPNDLVDLTTTPKHFVVVGSGKTATDACVWLLTHGVDPEAICWVRPRDPWMLNRAAVQPDPVVAATTAAETFTAAAESTSVADMFERLEASGVLLRIDPTVRPTMARTPTLARWELDLLRQIERVVRHGRVRRVAQRRLVLESGEMALPEDTLVVHCAASGLGSVPLRPIWEDGTITLQPVRFPCFGAALVGYVEATRNETAAKNRICPPTSYGNSLADWARMQVLGARAVTAFTSEDDTRAWTDDCVLNLARIAPADRDIPEVAAPLARAAAAKQPGLAALSRYAERG